MLCNIPLKFACGTQTSILSFIACFLKFCSLLMEVNINYLNFIENTFGI